MCYTLITFPDVWGNGTFVLHQTIRQLTLHSDGKSGGHYGPRYHAVRRDLLVTALFARRAAPLASTIGDGQLREAEVYLRRKAGHRVRVSPLHDAVVLSDSLGDLRWIGAHASRSPLMRVGCQLKIVVQAGQGRQG